MRKLQKLVSILAMAFLLVQSTMGVAAYVNRENPSERMGIRGQAPANAVNTNSTTDSNTSGSNSFTAEDDNGMTPLSEMEIRGKESLGDNSGTASLVGYIAGIILSLGGLAVTFVSWRKNKQINIAE